MSERNLPQILEPNAALSFPLERRETDLLAQARRLFDDGYFDHSLLDIWNASLHNLKRRVEAYSVDIFLSIVQKEPGRKKYKKDGDTLNERWEGVDALTLINGAASLGILNKKAGKALEMINWMRNHASPAHDSDERVEKEDVIALVILLQQNLFASPMPDPGHSASGLFEPVKSGRLGEEELQLLKDQIRSFRSADIRVTFGFMIDLLCEGEEPAKQNVKNLLPSVWERSDEDTKRTAGRRYHLLRVDPGDEEDSDAKAKAKEARTNLLDFLTEVGGIKYIPDAACAVIYRQAAKNLAEAKDRNYGWSSEETAAKTLEQFGTFVPSIAFEEVYQEILAVWCGNYWGRSKSHLYLRDFIDNLNTNQRRDVARMFMTNDRVKDELSQSKPKKRQLSF